MKLGGNRAGVLTSHDKLKLSDSIERGVMAWGVTKNPETHQRVEDWS